MRNRKDFFLLLVIISVALFFRFYNFREYHYWSGDEEVLTATLRHIIWDRSPTLIVQNANLGFGLGPFYHFFLTPFYYLLDFDLVSLQAIGSLLGVLTTFLVYLGGKEIGGKKLGFISSFLYASSFFVSLFDRRLVHLTLDPIMAALTFFLLAKVVKKNYKFLPFLAVPIGFSFHVDASLLVLVIGIAACWIYFKIPVFSKYTFLGLLILGIFSLPLIMAEIYYKGAVTKPMIQSISDRLKVAKEVPAGFVAFQSQEFFAVLGRVIFTVPSQYIEEHFFYSLKNPSPLFSPIPQFIVVLAFIVSFLLIFKERKNKADLVLWFLTASFILGIVIYNFFLRSNFFQHYFMVFFPIFILIFGKALSLLYQKSKLVFFIFLGFYLIVNFYTLINSSVRYPLYRKISLVNSSFKSIGSNNYSIYSSGDPYIHGGGWTELYTLSKHPPVKSYWYDFWGWIYAAYSLFPGPVQEEDPEVIVLIYKKEDKTDVYGKLIGSYNFKDIKIDILKNPLINY